MHGAADRVDAGQRELRDVIGDVAQVAPRSAGSRGRGASTIGFGRYDSVCDCTLATQRSTR